MIFIRVKDKRHKTGYDIVSFNANKITDEVIQFIKNNPKTYWISSYNGSNNEFYPTREDFLNVYDK